ncbi:MAG: crossover junction endodeoxyribonuclease RuvC [Alphaproteobacteria bacterium GM7ARS4]|nr:crossover junction endodeoxyribonuclease RuvC [Alphaproteobacteria bacterium GM7ARS4]
MVSVALDTSRLECRALRCRILGIDPGLRHSGWGVIDDVRHAMEYRDGGIITPPVKEDISVRLAFLYRRVVEIIHVWKPHMVAMEESFVRTDNAKSSLLLGMARGALLAAAGCACVSVACYAPNTIKRSLTSHGHGDKEQVMKMVMMVLPRAPKGRKEDFYDALAVALCHAQHHSGGRMGRNV